MVDYRVFPYYKYIFETNIIDPELNKTILETINNVERLGCFLCKRCWSSIISQQWVRSLP